MGDDVSWIELDFEFVLGLADFNASSDPGDRNRVTAGVQGDVAFDINDAFMQPVDFRNPNRQRFQMQSFDGEQLAWNRAEMFLVRAIDAIAPLARLLIQVGPTGECASGQEVIVDKIEGLMRSCA